MASLQKYQGRGKDANKTFFRTQPYLPDGRRVTIRLGSGQKQAEAAFKAIGDLIDSAKANVEPTPETKGWVEHTVKEPLCLTLIQCGLLEELPARLSGESLGGEILISQIADEYIATRGAGQSANTIAIYHKAKGNLIACFGDVDIRTLTARDGREFWRWLLEEGSKKVKKDETKGLGTNTAKQRLRFARAFFQHAIEDETIDRNPFKASGLKTSQTAAEKEYIPQSVIDDVIEQCPTHEWKLLLTLVRTIPTRIPSEIEELTWADVDVEKNTLLIHSPKTRTIGKSARLVPLLEPLKEMLAKAYQQAEFGEQYVFPTLRSNTNPATTAKKYVTKAKHKVWANFWNSIRASTETDLMDEYGLRRACQWAGNSPVTAMKNYALVRKTDFVDAGEAQKADAKSDAIETVDAKSDAEPASVTEQKPHEKSTEENIRSLPCSKVGAEGLEPPTLSV